MPENNSDRGSEYVKDTAKKIVDYIYNADGFDKIKHLFKVNDASIKIDVTGGNFLSYLFARPQSGLYEDSQRVFLDKNYYIHLNDESIECRLSNQWKGKQPVSTRTGNFLLTLIELINKYYADMCEIKFEAGKWHIVAKKKKFTLKDLPLDFQLGFPRRYITALLAKPFVILTGNSGTGKTRIAKQFAQYLECGVDGGQKNWLIVPVGADWTDNSKVLGFFNPLGNEGKGQYECTNIVKFMEQANQHVNIPYFLILDEMNLSHVERYFSDFLSHMEIMDIPFEIDGYGKSLKYPSNLFVVGTVNIDETTYMFSPKVLDRANVIEFKPVKDDVIKLFRGLDDSASIVPANDGSAEAFLSLAQEIRDAAIADTLDVEYIENVFSEIYDVLEGSGFEFAFRTVREIRQYISASCALVEDISSSNSFNLRDAIDEQLVQKIMPKIYGNKKEIGTLLDDLYSLCEKYDFVLSKAKIEQMKGKLAKVQYASFI